MNTISAVLVPCSICGRQPTMIQDEFGFSVWHDCINMSTRGAINQRTQESAEQAWKEMQK